MLWAFQVLTFAIAAHPCLALPHKPLDPSPPPPPGFRRSNEEKEEIEKQLMPKVLYDAT